MLVPLVEHIQHRVLQRLQEGKQRSQEQRRRLAVRQTTHSLRTRFQAVSKPLIILRKMGPKCRSSSPNFSRTLQTNVLASHGQGRQMIVLEQC